MKKLIGILLVTAAAFSSCAKFTGDPGINPIVTTEAKNSEQGHTPDSAAPTDSLINVKGSLTLQLGMDSVNTENIQLNFYPNSPTSYIPGVDAPVLQDFGKVSFAWISSDNVPLSTYTMPLTPAGAKIGLRVDAQADGIYSLNLESLKSVPLPYDLWLMDKYQKDSLELRYNHSYAFNIKKADTSSFGANRFKLVIRLR